MSFKFEKMKRSHNDEVMQNHLYVTYSQFCQCNCDCCRNKTFSENIMKQKQPLLNQKIEENARYFRHIIFGGGEPLFQIENIVSVISRIQAESDNFLHDWSGPYFDPNGNEIKFSIVTNGDSKIFLNSINNDCHICSNFKKIILSRYHYDDETNQKIFKAKRKLIKSKELEGLCLPLKAKIQLSCLCQKGGIQNVEDATNYIKWAAGIGISEIMFSNFQDDVTPEEKQGESSVDTLESIQEMLISKWKFSKEEAIAFSAGYTVINYKGYVPIKIEKGVIQKKNWFLKIFSTEPKYETIEEEIQMKISFREFISDDEKMKIKWKNARRKTFNYSIMPNGEMYADWSCGKKTE